MKDLSPIEKRARSITNWVGSPASIIVHTIVFVVAFLLSAIGIIPFDRMLLVLTTIVSLEAIYLAIFIQMSVNFHGEALEEVEQGLGEIQEDMEEIQEDIEDIQEDVEEIGEDMEELQEDLGEIQEDVEEISEDLEELDESDEEERAEEKRKLEQRETLQNIYDALQQLAGDIEKLKKK